MAIIPFAGESSYLHVDRDLIQAPENAFARGKGREFGRWIDYADAIGTTRDTANGAVADPGYNEGDLIENPIYIVESLYRDEQFVERDLIVTSSAATTTFTCKDVNSRTDDYYNNAEFFDVTAIVAGTGVKRYVTDYVGSTNLFTINGVVTGMADDNFFLTNIQGDNKINVATFDTIGNTSNGSRRNPDNWLFARSINTKQSIQSLINEILFECHCVLFESADESGAYSKIKVKALDSGSGDTWSKPAYAEGVPQVKLDFTDLSQVFTSFKLFYHYDPGKGDYLKSILVDKNGYSNPSGGSTLTDEHKNLCSYAEKTYQVINPFVYSTNWIYDDATAEFFLEKKINWFTKQRLKVTWITPFADNIDDIDYIKYELGDQVKLNYSAMIPSGINNSSYFMITDKSVITNPQGCPYILWNLLEM